MRPTMVAPRSYRGTYGFSPSTLCARTCPAVGGPEGIDTVVIRYRHGFHKLSSPFGASEGPSDEEYQESPARAGPVQRLRIMLQAGQSQVKPLLSITGPDRKVPMGSTTLRVTHSLRHQAALQIEIKI